MKIVVCVQQAARVCGQGGVNPEAEGLDPSCLVHVLNPFDEVAVEEALRIRDAAGEGAVTVVTVGPARAEEALRWCLAMGADAACHICSEQAGQLDTWAVAHLLARFLSTVEYDMILFGRQTIDYGSGQTGIFVAELLGLPVVVSALKLQLGPNPMKIMAERALERGNRAVVESTLPAVITTDKGMNRPRYPTLRGRQVASVKVVHRVEAVPEGGDGVPRTTVVKVAPAKLRPKKILSPDSSLSPSEKLKFMMRGGVAEKKGDSVGGTPAQAAAGIIDFLRERNLL